MEHFFLWVVDLWFIIEKVSLKTFHSLKFEYSSNHKQRNVHLSFFSWHLANEKTCRTTKCFDRDGMIHVYSILICMEMVFSEIDFTQKYKGVHFKLMNAKLKSRTIRCPKKPVFHHTHTMSRICPNCLQNTTRSNAFNFNSSSILPNKMQCFCVVFNSCSQENQLNWQTQYF